MGSTNTAERSPSTYLGPKIEIGPDIRETARSETITSALKEIPTAAAVAATRRMASKNIAGA